MVFQKDSSPKFDIGVDIEFGLGKEPSWLIRSGSGLIFSTLFLLAILSVAISYPDQIKTDVTITSSIPPVDIISQVDGRILEFNVRNGETVRNGQVLAIIESDEDFRSITKLENNLIGYRNGNYSRIELTSSLKSLHAEKLGSLQETIADLTMKLEAFKHDEEMREAFLKTNFDKRLLEKYQSLNKNLANKKSLMIKALEAEEKQVLNEEKLSKTGLLSKSQLSSKKKALAQSKISLEDIRIQIENNQLAILNIQKSLFQSNAQYQRLFTRYQTEIIQYFDTLRNKIEKWKKDYLIRAPISGRVSLNEYWSVNQNALKGKVMMTITSDDAQLIATGIVPHKNSGKLALNQKVMIDLVSYPSVDYGKVIGYLDALSHTPGSNGYLVTIKLPQQLTTNHDVDIPYSPLLIGTAAVTTNKTSLFDRIIGSVLQAFEN